MTTRLDAKGPKEVTGADVSEATGLEVLNPELHIATLAEGATLSVELGIAIGRGYVAADAHAPGVVPAGAIAVDAAFSPIQRVTYNVENARLGKITDFERLIVEIWTNGAVAPDEALAARRHVHARPLRLSGAPRRPGGRGGSGRGGARASCRRACRRRSRSWGCPPGPSTRSRTRTSSRWPTSSRRPTRTSKA